MLAAKTMEKEEQQQPQQQQSTVVKRYVLGLNCLVLAVGTCGGPLVSRLYFVHGGKRVWLSSWLQTSGWPIIFIPLAISYFHRVRVAADVHSNKTKVILIKPRLLLGAAIIGLLTGFETYMYAYAVAQLPVSTFALILVSELAFTAAFAYLLVKQKFTSFSLNAIVLLTIGGAVLAMHTSADRPAGESTKQYITGFLMSLGAAMLYGFILPLVELTYKKARQQITYTLVLEFQLVISLFATIVTTVGMLINNDFQAIPKEASKFGIGETKYYVVLVFIAILWQSFFLGAIGVIFSSSSLFSEIVIALLLPITEILAILIFKEKFQPEKGVSFVLSLWGFVSYFYGEIQQNNKKVRLQPSTTQVTNV